MVLLPVLLFDCSDLHVMHGDVKFPTPAVMGHEMSGEVVDCGADVASYTDFDLRPGTKVAVPFIIPCGSCHYCNKGKEDLCEKFVKFNRSAAVSPPALPTSPPCPSPPTIPGVTRVQGQGSDVRRQDEAVP